MLSLFVLYENLYQNIVACQDEEGEESVFHSGFPPLMAADGWDAQQQSVAFNPFDPMDRSAQHLAHSGEEEWGFEQNAEELLKQASRKKGCYVRTVSVLQIRIWHFSSLVILILQSFDENICTVYNFVNLYFEKEGQFVFDLMHMPLKS
jgi:hypothetical protein